MSPRNIDFAGKYRVPQGKSVSLREWDADDTAGLKSRDEAESIVKENLGALADLQYRLYAENRRALLIVLQAMDAGGKDGVIRHVMTGLNPQGCRVTPFKAPSATERDHDFLWRIHRAVPPRGEIGIFNRSHYEDVLIVRVRKMVPKSVWSRRYRQILRFERNLLENGIEILKFYLHISKSEQRKRLQKRIDDPRRNWKISRDDLSERKLWKDYIAAYEEALGRCSQSWTPWYVIPANKKWFRNLAVSQIVLERLRAMDPRLPAPVEDLTGYRVK